MERHEFELYKEEVEVKTKKGVKKFTLLPLSGRFYGKLMTVAGKFMNKKADDSPEDFFKDVDEQTFSDLHLLVFETLRHSMKVEDKNDLEQLDLFVSQNLMQFIGPLIKVNIGSEE